MARQTGDILFYGTRQDGNGYIDREGRPVFRQKPGPSRAAWKRKPAFARSRMAAAEFGERMEGWWALWRRVPKAMRLLVVGKTGEAPSGFGLVEGWKGGFAIAGDEVPLGLDVELEGPSSPSSPSRASGASGASGTAKDADGRKRVWDHASGGDDLVGAIRIWGLAECELECELENLESGGRKRREFLPVAGHHVTGGMGAAKSKQRRRVVAQMWNAGQGLMDRRELELARWDEMAKAKGFAGRDGWFAAMAGTMGGSEGMNGLNVADIRVRVHWCVCGADGVRSFTGDWVRLRELLRVRLPAGLEGALFVGLEFGFVRNLTPSPSPKEKGAPCVLLPLPCLNRMWYCGMRETVRKYGTRTDIRHGSTRRLRGRADARGAVRGARVGVVASELATFMRTVGLDIKSYIR